MICSRCIPAAIRAATSGFPKHTQDFQHGADDVWRIECSNDGKPSWCGCAKWFHHFDRWELSNKDPASTNQVLPDHWYFGGSPGLKFQLWKRCRDAWHGSLESNVEPFWAVYYINERYESKHPFGGSLCWRIIYLFVTQDHFFHFSATLEWFLFKWWCCWWLKSRTTWDLSSLENNGISYLSSINSIFVFF